MGFIKQKLCVERRAGRDSAAAEARCVNNNSKCKTQQIGDAKCCRGRHKTRVGGATLILSELQPLVVFSSRLDNLLSTPLKNWAKRVKKLWLLFPFLKGLMFRSCNVEWHKTQFKRLLCVPKVWWLMLWCILSISSQKSFILPLALSSSSSWRFQGSKHTQCCMTASK